MSKIKQISKKQHTVFYRFSTGFEIIYKEACHVSSHINFPSLDHDECKRLKFEISLYVMALTHDIMRGRRDSEHLVKNPKSKLFGIPARVCTPFGYTKKIFGQMFIMEEVIEKHFEDNFVSCLRSVGGFKITWRIRTLHCSPSYRIIG